MSSYEFYFSDLTEEAQSRYLEFLNITDAKEANMDMNVFPIGELWADDEVEEVQEELFPEEASSYADKERDVEEFKENKNRWQLFQDKSSMSIELRDIIDDKDRT